MSNTDINAPAFPSGEMNRFGVPNTFPIYEGISIRDYFAARAMNAFSITRQGMNNKIEAGHIAAHAYLMADAMLEARKL